MNVLLSRRRSSSPAPPCAAAACWLLLLLLLVPASCGGAHTATSQSDFRFEYTFQAGYGVAPIRLEINGRRATLVRRAADVAGEPIGVFGAHLNEQDVARLERSFPADVDAAASPAVARDAGAHLIKLKTAARQIEIGVANEPAALKRFARLIEEIERVKAGLLKSPARTLSLTLPTPPAATTGAGSNRRLTIVVRLSNAGVDPVTVNAAKLWVESAAPRPALVDPQATPLPAVWRKIGGPARPARNMRIDGGSHRDVEIVTSVPESLPLLLRAVFESEGEMNVDGAELFGSASSDAVEVD